MGHNNKIRRIDLTLCLNCYSCEKACKKRHGNQKFKRGEIKEFRDKHIVLLACRQCKVPLCLKACKKDAHAIDDKGNSYIIPEKCIGCGLCAKKCPFSSIFMIVAEGDKQEQESKKTKKKASKCDGCREYKKKACFSNCPTEALIQTSN